MAIASRAMGGLLALALAAGCPSTPSITDQPFKGDGGDDGVNDVEGGDAGQLGDDPALDAGAGYVVDGGPHGPHADAGDVETMPSDAGGSEDDAGSTMGATDAGIDDFETAAPPPMPVYSGGTCPTLVVGSTQDTSLNTGFMSGGESRDFRVLVPPGYDGSEKLPVVFGWHWLNGSSASFIENGEFETAIEEFNFIAVLPDTLRDDGGDKVYQFNWPFAEFWGVESEITFLEDMLACVSEQLSVDETAIHAIGVSAGGLWATYLSTTEQAARFSSFVVLSGGLGKVGPWEMEFVPQPRKFPAVVLWGGPTDYLGVYFHEASQHYRDALLADGHFVVVCEHDAGHAMPPLDPPEGGGTLFSMFWEFMDAHPYALAPGTSPYQASGLPSSFPSWCGIAPW